MDMRTFAILCHLLRTVSGLSSIEIVDVEEIVAMFLHVLVHDVKNRVIQREFVWSGETVSRHFNLVRLAIVRLYEELIKRPVPVTNNYNDQRWKCFENCLGALDGTYIKVNVPATDRTTFRMRKGEIAINVLDVCDTKGNFVYVLPGWEGSAADSRILSDAFFHEKMDYMILLSVRCGLSKRGGVSRPVQRPVVPFARVTCCWKCADKCKGVLQHSSVRNVIEHAFGVLKDRWAILRGKLYYPQQVQCRTILACCLLHNLINRETTYCNDVNDVDEGDSTYATTTASEDIHYIETTNEWSQWREKLAESMFTDWQLRNA
ncbi:retrotransposon protein [Cucumis melo var. makuwa]|uniref:Retrotransposon protein n=1 Tax=Cucumis melo var. makuwa TaxID=1194695 RepID=A0A5D3CVA3_CUCMM|nr:retrotransposon protein [Cucumis melo var. makuwa]